MLKADIKDKLNKNKDLNDLFERIMNREYLDSFKDKLVKCIYELQNDKTLEKRGAISQLIEEHFLSDDVSAIEAKMDTFLKDEIGIREIKQSQPQKQAEKKENPEGANVHNVLKRAEMYDQLSARDPKLRDPKQILEKAQKNFESRRLEYLGIDPNMDNEEAKSQTKKGAVGALLHRFSNFIGESFDIVLQKFYFILPSFISGTPGKISREVLDEKKKQIRETNEQLNSFISHLSAERNKCDNRDNARNLSDEDENKTIKQVYSQMLIDNRLKKLLHDRQMTDQELTELEGLLQTNRLTTGKAQQFRKLLHAGEFTDEELNRIKTLGHNVCLTEEKLKDFEGLLDKKKKEKLSSIRTGLQELQYGKLKDKLTSLLYDGTEINISPDNIDKEVQKVLSKSKIGKDESIVLPNGSMFKGLIEGQDDLVNMLKKYVQSAKAKDLSDEEVFNISKNITSGKGVRDDSKEKDFLELIVELSLNGNLPNNAESTYEQIKQCYEEYVAISGIEEEVLLEHNIKIAQELASQLDGLNKIIVALEQQEQQNEGLTSEEELKRAFAVKLAVAKLSNGTLHYVIMEEDAKRARLMKMAKKRLLPGLGEARNTGNKTFRRVFEGDIRVGEGKE